MKLDDIPINALVLEGGGTSMVAFYIGLFQALNIEPADLPFKLAGSSAGAIAVALFIAGYVKTCNAETVESFMQECFGYINFANVLDQEYLISYSDVMGLMRDHFPRLFELTMLDAQIITGQPITFLCTLMQNDNTLETLRINASSHPNMTLADAAYVSSAIPLCFEFIHINDMPAIDGDMLPCDVYHEDEIHLVCKYNESLYGIDIPFVNFAVKMLSVYWRFTFANSRKCLQNVTTVHVPILSSLQMSGLCEMLASGREFASRFTFASDVSNPEHRCKTPGTLQHTTLPT